MRDDAYWQQYKSTTNDAAEQDKLTSPLLITTERTPAKNYAPLISYENLHGDYNDISLPERRNIFAELCGKIRVSKKHAFKLFCCSVVFYGAMFGLMLIILLSKGSTNVGIDTVSTTLGYIYIKARYI